MNDLRNDDDPIREAATPADQTAGNPRRKPYRSPELVEYGSVAKLTQGTLSMNADFIGGGFRMTSMCL